MLSSRQRRRCREIAASLDHGSLTEWLKAEASLGPEERAEIWSMRQHVTLRAQRAAGKRTPPPLKDLDDDDEPMPDLGPQPEDVPDDAWPEDDDNDDGAPPEQSPTVLCRQCRGTGRDKTGSKCSGCNGVGRVRAPVDDDDDDDTWGDEKESFRYEIEFDED
jgi:hypothetical protein